MNRLRVSFVVVVATLTIGAGSALAAGPYPPPSKGTGHVEPSRIKVGECAVFSGDGFAPLRSVAVSDSGASRGSATTNGSGQFSKQLCYGTDAKRGRHDLVGTGTGADRSALSVYAMLIVEGVSQSASNPGTHRGGAAAPSTGGSAVTFTGGTGGAAQAPAAIDAGPGSSAPASTPKSGGRFVLLGAGVALAFVSSLTLLLLARRRRRGQGAVNASPVPA